MFGKIFSRSKKKEELGPAITRGCNIAMLQRKYPYLTTAEMCGNCGEEVIIPAYFASKCPSCGKRILPCSMCDWNDMPCDECPFKENRKASKVKPIRSLSKREINRCRNSRHGMTIADCQKFMGGEFYHVERHKGKNMIKINGYYYGTGSDEEDRYRFMEFVGAVIDPDQLRRDGWWDENEFNAGIMDLTEEEIVEMISDDADGVVVLDMKKVTDSTPEGWYYSPVN